MTLPTEEVSEYSDREINEAIDKVLSAAVCLDYLPQKKGNNIRPNYKSGTPYDRPGELVATYSSIYPALKYATEKHWARKLV